MDGRLKTSKHDAYCVKNLGWSICRVSMGEDDTYHAVPIEHGFASENEAEKAFRDKYAEKHERGIHGNGNPRIIRERDLLGD